MKIRAFIDQDFADVERIYNLSKLDELKFEHHEFQLIPLTQDKKRFAQLMESDIYLLESDDQVIAMAGLYQNEVRAFFVHSDHRGNGYARRLLQHVLAQAEGVVSLQVLASNQPAKQLYLKCGFVVSETISGEYGGVPLTVERMIRPDLFR